MESNKLVFRFDDVRKDCENGYYLNDLHNKLTDYLFEKFPGCEVIWAISPITHSSEATRVFPKEWNALSDPTVHYQLNTMGMPNIHPKVTVATHGICHVDHRLLKQSAQEMSIVLSANIVGAKMFVPPFNKWNNTTEYICQAHGIELIKFEDGWRSMEHNKMDLSVNLWYLHAREWTLESFKKWFGDE